ncbi:MAG: endonuclease/exonuclease/phosphatase family protein [Bryobacterales bacterium]|jgi:endonuclease/exonuclease/phosphatase (EEP) superfamily protein YafD|nr:endonuclease/exonuclease/phosphatase family protein [Bryobacterales bacterium]
MVRFLFWNLNRKKFPEILRRAVHDHSADIVILAESPWSDAQLLWLLNADAAPATPVFQLPFTNCKRIQIVSRFSPNSFPPRLESDYFTMRSLVLPEREELLLVCLHLPSKLYASDDRLALSAGDVSRRIRELEATVRHERTVVVGDFNLNPFEAGMIAVGAFHATRALDVARRHRRVVNGTTYPFFYNPMWQLYTASNGAPPGTYYYEQSEQVAHFWHVFDQVLIRPSLLPRFDHRALQVLHEVVGVSLLDGKGRPDPAIASDHLPLTFQLEF